MTIKNDAQIEAEMQGIINAEWPPAARERVLRTGTGKTALNAFFASMTALKAEKIAARDLEQAVAGYDAAVVRLAQDALLAADYPDVDGMPNPVLAADNAERVAAQAVVDGAAQPVLDIVAARAVDVPA